MNLHALRPAGREASGKLAGVRALSKGVDHGVAGVMPRAGITPAGIAKANDKLRRLERHSSSPSPLRGRLLAFLFFRLLSADNFRLSRLGHCRGSYRRFRFD